MSTDATQVLAATQCKTAEAHQSVLASFCPQTLLSNCRLDGGAYVPITGYAGIVKAVSFPGVLMDIGHARRLAYAKSNSEQEWIQYNRLRGQHASAMEHATPERFFDDRSDDVAPEGVSAVNALAVAGHQGQKIYTLTQANQSQLVNIQQRAEVRDEIRAALAAGKEVTVHQGPISYEGFHGAGYAVIDRDTGAGACLIAGGKRGSFVLTVLVGLMILGTIASGLVLPIIFMSFAASGGFAASLLSLLAAAGSIAMLEPSGGHRFEFCAAIEFAGFALALRTPATAGIPLTIVRAIEKIGLSFAAVGAVCEAAN